MTDAPPRPGVQEESDQQAEAAFKEWVHRLVKGAAERRAFETGQVDAIMDSETGSAILLSEARAALRLPVVPARAPPRPPRDPGAARARRMAAAGQAMMPNRLLAALPVREYERLFASLQPVTLTYGDVLYEPGEPMRYVYFPGDCLVSLLTTVDRCLALEVGLVGREGMVGARLALGVTTSSSRALVQGTGTALRVGTTRFLRELARSPALRRAVLLFTDALMTQAAQAAACNRFHVVEARLARWLLMTQERLPVGGFRLTQEFLADMLGVRRAGVTLAAGALQRRKLIHYRRGMITILDQKGLDAAACSCYQRVRLTP